MLGLADGADGSLRDLGRVQPHPAPRHPDGVVEDLRLERIANSRTKCRKTRRKRLKDMEKTEQRIWKLVCHVSKRRRGIVGGPDERFGPAASNVVEGKHTSDKGQSLSCRSCFCKSTRRRAMSWEIAISNTGTSGRAKAPAKLQIDWRKPNHLFVSNTTLHSKG